MIEVIEPGAVESLHVFLFHQAAMLRSQRDWLQTNSKRRGWFLRAPDKHWQAAANFCIIQPTLVAMFVKRPLLD